MPRSSCLALGGVPSQHARFKGLALAPEINPPVFWVLVGVVFEEGQKAGGFTTGHPVADD